MSTAILKVQHPSQPPDERQIDPAILVAATAASPEPVALTENGKAIYSNRSFAQLSAESSGIPQIESQIQRSDPQPAQPFTLTPRSEKAGAEARGASL